MPKKYEMSFELNGDIDPKLTRTFDTMSRDVRDLGDDLESLRRTGGLRKLDRDAMEARGTFRQLTEDVQQFRDVFERTLQFTGAHAIITGTAGALGNMVGEFGALDDSVGHMGAATGATTEEMAQFKDTIEDIYNANVGEGFKDIADSLVNVRQVTDLSGEALQNATRDALILRDTFNYDVSETVRTVDALMRNMGLTADEAFNLIAQGSQKGLNRSGDLLDTLNEYSVHFSDAGYSAEEMFSILESGIKNGAFNLDKMGDLMKEFTIRIQSGDKAVSDAMGGLFGSAGRDTIIDGLADGSIQARDALDQIITELDQMEDANQRNEIAVGLFGTQYEDLRDSAVQALQETNGEFSRTLDTMQQMEDVKYDSLIKDIRELGRQMMDEIVIPIGEDLMPTLQNLTEWASDNTDLLKVIALGVPAGILAKNVIGITRDLSNVQRSFLDTSSDAGRFGKAFSLLPNPIGLAVGALGLITTGVIAYKEHQEEARQELIHMGEDIDKAFSDYEAVEQSRKRTEELTKEYDRLSAKIRDAETPAAQLTEARRKMKLVEEELIQLNPEILKAEDAKKASFRDQIDLANELLETRSNTTKIILDSEVTIGKSELPELENEYGNLSGQLSDLANNYDNLRRQYEQIDQYEAKEASIRADRTLSIEEQNQKIRDLIAEYQNLLGIDKDGNMGDFIAEMDGMRQSFEELPERMQTLQTEIGAMEESFQSLYDKQASLIEMELGGSLEDLAAKYDELSSSEKQRFDQAILEIEELNAAMDMLPESKKIDVSVVYQQTGRMPDFSTPEGKASRRIALRDPGFNGYAEGGLITKPELAWVGEGGDNEYIIPVNNSQRSKDLYAAAGNALGMSSSGHFAPVYSPKFEFYGPVNEQMVRKAADDSQRKWEQHMANLQRQQARRNLA
ncbi:phage tail tape measure protein [Paenibacillus provencensis]|uniref:Phage tail tape measure protein n=1 Tax=Paenibacillus provencensis TaxID=441151 RepID=A0ABW3PRT9_9BACL|nr:phage tail tape measure protein [Paenibacillus sp. MER 78]MCM3129019.1 phage tail tape measure protein [Paenibacillus sp. MER 78]